LKDYRGLKVFIGADMASKIKKVSVREKLSEKAAQSKIEKVENERENHCYYFTHKHWRDSSNYDFYIKSDIFGTEKTAKLIADMAREKFEL
jgi:cytidylate kinase